MITKKLFIQHEQNCGTHWHPNPTNKCLCGYYSKDFNDYYDDAVNWYFKGVKDVEINRHNSHTTERILTYYDEHMLQMSRDNKLRQLGI